MSEVNIMQGVCRCCLSESRRDLHLHKEYYLNGRRRVIMDMFTEYLNINLTPDVRLTTLICKVCMGELLNAQKFRELVLDSEKQLLNMIDSNCNELEFVPVQIEPLMEEDCYIKTEVKAESLQDVSENGSNDIEATVNLVPGEREFLQRCTLVRPLPTRKSLAIISPAFYGCLESLRGKTIKSNTIDSEQHRPPKAKERIQSKRTKKSKKKGINVTEKMAQVLNATTVLENSNAAIFKSKMRSGFPCFYCKKIYNNLKLLRDHQVQHPKKVLFKLLSKYSLDAFIIYADITNLKCTLCNEDINNLTNLKDHLVYKHHKRWYTETSDRVISFKLYDKESNFDCHICGTHFQTFGAIDRHMNAHFKNFICAECGSGFITKHRLNTHTYKQHRSDVTVCEICKKTFPTRFKYKIHWESVHEKLKKMKCSMCSERFIDYFTRQRHMELKHGVKLLLYKCSQCDRSFNRKYVLTCHIKRVHLEKRDVQCEMCPFMCYNKSELKEHMVKHGVNKYFECTVCQKTFLRKKTLIVHMRVHSDRLSCHICDQTFAEDSSLQTHSKTHGVEYASL